MVEKIQANGSLYHFTVTSIQDIFERDVWSVWAKLPCFLWVFPSLLYFPRSTHTRTGAHAHKHTHYSHLISCLVCSVICPDFDFVVHKIAFPSPPLINMLHNISSIAIAVISETYRKFSLHRAPSATAIEGDYLKLFEFCQMLNLLEWPWNSGHGVYVD